MSISVSYSRVSTLKEEQQRSLHEQQEQWSEIIEREGDTIAECGAFYTKKGRKQRRIGMYVDEGVSGKDYKHRLAFMQMVEDGMKQKFQKIYVEDTSRFARCAEDGMTIIKDLREKGVNVYFRKESLNSIEPNNDMILTVLFASAEKENQMRSERFKWIFGRLHTKGKWNSHAPHGYRVKETKLSIKEDEVEVVRFIFYLYTERLFGTRTIANILNERGIKTRDGNLWKSTKILYMLKNPMYKGDVVNHRTESFDITRGTRRKIPKEEQIVVHKEELRIVSDETWNKAQEILKKRREKLDNREGYSTRHEFSTMLYCNQCGSTFIRVKKHRRKKDAPKEYMWTCLGHNHYGDIKCKGIITLDEKELLKCVKKELEDRKKSDDKWILEIYKKEKKEALSLINVKDLETEVEDMNLQIIDLRQEKNKKIINEETYKEQVIQINKKLKGLRTDINKYYNIEDDLQVADIKFKEQRELIENINFDKIDNQTLRKIFDKIIVIVDSKKDKKYITLNFIYNFLDEIEDEVRSNHGKDICVKRYRAFNYSDLSLHE